jgi:uncharacterized protein
MLVQIQNSPDSAVVPSQTESPSIHFFQTEFGKHALLVNGSRVFTLPPEVAERLESEVDTETLLSELGLSSPQYVSDETLVDPPVRSLSLAIAQKCNLGCTYCYAQEGDFGGKQKNMEAAIGLRAVDLLFSDTAPGETVHVAFLGGEPLINRKLLRDCTERANEKAVQSGASVAFSITTNGTLVTPEDGEFFEAHGFAVTVSLDGIGQVHNRLRPFKGGQASYEKVLANVKPLLALQRRMQVSARATITPDNLILRETLDEFLGMGFHSVGFSPMLSSPSARGQMNAAELSSMLEQMIACGEEFERRVARGERYAFLNMMNALREIHKGTHRPYPCGAGAGYFGVSSEGGLYACHRFVEDEARSMGDVHSGVDRRRQAEWLAARHVHRQEPCQSCWARYLCGGGCHHEVIHRGRPACSYIKGWLHYCLEAYIRLLERCPEYFNA